MNPVDQWLNNGAGADEGLRLLSKLAPNPTTERLVRLNPKRYGFLLEKALKPFASGVIKTVSAGAVRSFRKDWSFLSEPDCPLELKILAADKITAYHNYTSAHRELSSCTTPEECFATAKKIIENYKQNRKILSEFAYYQEHRKVLGKHPIFSEIERISELRTLPVLALVRRKKNLEGAIWRAKNEIAKGDKPHLLIEREERIASKTRELREVERLITDYEEKKY